MKHLKALAIKFIVISIVLFSILAVFYSASLADIFVLSVLVTGLAYVIGDLYILPRFGNLIATISDFGLSFIAIWLLSNMLFEPPGNGILFLSFFSAILISSSEAVFHLYMQNKVLGEEEVIYVNRSYTANNFQTEFSEEQPDKDIIELHKKRDEDH
ncbi:YndM family protein [Aquibacillus koreensis]|uniref:YndM family protein n=1 Tax=Aquibacillus koreensis TaxID=279446 RepID=A0A9X3WKM6_9BACI|nr:YndM family protein [Aquibacillus koreensis]MCT2535949.1 YndM family protein [Aquibacillus koreensis]MDC3420405.1 YndM family protein [Aquibacillus koreensis]